MKSWAPSYFPDEELGALAVKVQGELGVEVAVVADGVHVGKAGAAGEHFVVDASGAGDRLIAGHLVGAVFGDHHGEVVRGILGDGDQRAQAHERAAVAVEDDDASLRLSQGETEGEGRRLAHRAFDHGEVERSIREARPGHGDAHGGDDDFIGAASGQFFQTDVFVEHDQINSPG